jgi:hypothetical protein
MAGDDKVGGKGVNSAAWRWLEVGWPGRRSLAVERRKGAETPSSHDKRHLGAIHRGWKKKEINAACRGHGDPPYGDRVGWEERVVESSGRSRAVEGGCIGAVGRGEGARQKEMVYCVLVRSLTHPCVSVACLWPPISGRAGAGWGMWVEDGERHGGVMLDLPSPGTAQPGDSPFRGHDPKRCGRK